VGGAVRHQLEGTVFDDEAVAGVVLDVLAVRRLQVIVSSYQWAPFAPVFMKARNEPGAARRTVSIQPAARNWRQTLQGYLPGASQIATPRTAMPHRR
jgi:hypothetical protein